MEYVDNFEHYDLLSQNKDNQAHQILKNLKYDIFIDKLQRMAEDILHNENSKILKNSK